MLRHFNRSFTRRIAVLSDSYLDTGRPLGPARVLFELGQGPTRVVDLRRRLGLDSGYLSRLLRHLEGEALVAVRPDPGDRRQRTVELTPAGRREWRRLERRSQRAASVLLDRLSGRQRAELASALVTAERLLAVATVTAEIVDPRSPAAERALESYFAELDQRFRSGFDPGHGGAADDAESLVPPHGAFLLLTSDEVTVGCGGVKRLDDTTAEIKRMWVHPDWRGLGLGRLLLERLEAIARQRGRLRVVLDTNATLSEAIGLYTRANYRPINRYNDNPYAERWFAKRLGGRSAAQRGEGADEHGETVGAARATPSGADLRRYPTC